MRTDVVGLFCTSWIKTGRQKGTGKCQKQTFTPEQIVTRLRQIEVLVSQGKTVPPACKEAGIVQQTFCRWRKEYGGLQLEQAKRLKELLKENAQLRRAMADLTVGLLDQFRLQVWWISSDHVFIYIARRGGKTTYLLRNVLSGSSGKSLLIDREHGNQASRVATKVIAGLVRDDEITERF